MNILSIYRWADLPKLIGLAVCYALIIWIVLAYLTAQGEISVVWIPSGLGVAALLLGGKKYWVAIFIGAMFAYLSIDRPLLPAFFIALSNVIEPLLLVWMLAGNGKFNRDLQQPSDYLLLTLFGALSAAVTATIGVLTLIFNGVIPAGAFLHGAMLWWMGNLLGIALITPLLLVWKHIPKNWFQGNIRRIETVLFLALTFLTCEIVFGDWLKGSIANVPRDYLMFLFVAWGAIRFGRHGVTLVILLTAIQGLLGAIDIHGLFAEDIQKTELTNYWLYMMTLGFVGISMATTINARRRNEETIRHQAHYDELTKLPNRRLFRDRLDQAILKAQRDGGAVTLMLIDLDRFKEVNDTLGHDAGDILLVEAARRIQRCVREADTVARMGGDEFVVILNAMGESVGIERVAQNIINLLNESFTLGNSTAYISASIGITLYPTDATDIEDLLKHADQAMYVSKAMGRNRYCYFTQTMQESAQERLRLSNDLRNALEDRQFRVYYQPIVDLATGEIHKAEALIRWQHPTRGLIYPADFIPLAEESGMINRIGDWVFKQAANQCKIWKQKHNPAFQISVNKSPVQFHREDSDSQEWLDLLRELELPGRNITIEITEGLLLNAKASVQDKLLALRDAGIQVSIDDFGTGYSSLAYLKKFDIDQLKIDQSFVRNLQGDQDDMALCEAIIVMAHKLGLKVIAEGVETIGQRDLLKLAGCDYAQGYWFSKPVPAEEFELILQRGAVRDGTRPVQILAE